MKKETLSMWIKWSILGLGLCGGIIYFLIVPIYGLGLAEQAVNAFQPIDTMTVFWIWLLFIWGTAIPCYAVLVCGWKISSNICKINAFCEENARLLKTIMFLALGDCIYFFVGNITLLLCSINHPSVVLLSFFIVFIGSVIAVVAAVLSHFVYEGTRIRKENEWTI